MEGRIAITQLSSHTIGNLLDADPVERALIADLLTDVHPANLAEYMARLDDESTVALFRLLSPEQAASVLAEADENTRRVIADEWKPTELATVIGEMDPDDGVDFLELIADEEAEKAVAVLAGLDSETLQDIEPLRQYDDDSAGGIMTNQFISVGISATMSDALAAIRRDSEHVENISSVYVTDADGKLRGVLSVREIIVNDPNRPAREVMTSGEQIITVAPDTDQEDVYQVLTKYDFPMVPVVDGSGKLLGVVTFDDVLDVVTEEADEDLRMIAGMNEHDPIHGDIWRRVFSRLPWLMITLVGTFITAGVLAGFEHTITTIAATMFFVPAVTAMSGNVGLQSSTTFVRALAMGTVDFSMVFKLVSRELVTGGIIGGVCGALVGTAALIIGGDVKLGLVVGIAMIVAISFSSMVGTIVPILLDRFNMDPALGAGPFITTLNDIVALTIYLTIATALLIWYQPLG